MANSTASAGHIGARNRTNADIEHWDVESEEF
jgi:NNP family nitrate/nitrite transporter-like MFS transporter